MKLSITLHALLLLVIAAFVAGFARGYVARGRAAPAPTVQAAVVHSRAAAAAVTVADTAYERAVVTAGYWFAKYDSVRRRPQLVRVDTVTHDSIAYIPVAIADSAVHGCRLALNSCAGALAAKDTLISALHTEIAARQAASDAARPSRLHQLLHDVTLAGASGAVGYGACRAGVRFSLPVPIPHF